MGDFKCWVLKNEKLFIFVGYYPFKDLEKLKRA